MRELLIVWQAINPLVSEEKSCEDTIALFFQKLHCSLHQLLEPGNGMCRAETLRPLRWSALLPFHTKEM